MPFRFLFAFLIFGVTLAPYIISAAYAQQPSIDKELIEERFINWSIQFIQGVPAGALNVINKLNKYATLIAAGASLFAALSALYLGYFRAWFQKPNLKVSFSELKEYPYFHNLAFEPFGIPIIIDGQETHIFRPGFNARVKVENIGRTTAKNVRATIEKIEFLDNEKRVTSTQYYHPTTVKWSGERYWKPVDIVPESHFFLDLFWSINETQAEILSFNETRIKNCGINLRSDLLKEIIEKDIQPSGEIYWNVWIDNSYDRGIPKKYAIPGRTILYFVINAENCSPVRFEAVINWTFETWNQPDINIQIG